jgi:hypothetical protein
MAAVPLCLACLSGACGGSEQPSTAGPEPRREEASPGPQPAAAPREAKPIHFTDVTADSGLDASTTSGRLPSSQILEVKGAGLALFDMDGDGDLDLFVPNGATLDAPDAGPGARVFENLGGLRFRDVTETSGVSHRRWSFGTAVGDVDGDGREDLYICCFGPDVLLRNTTEPGGPIRFEDVTAASGISDDAWSASAAMGDLDGDGDLDIHVTTYLEFDPARPPGPTLFKSIPVMSGPFGMRAQVDLLYENLGGGRFREVGELAGLRAVEAGYGLNAAILDFTGDGRPDIFVGNDSQPNNLFRNDTEPSAAATGSGEATRLRFTDIGLASGVAVNIEGSAQATMGVGIADVDGNGRPDVFSTNFSSDTNTLHLNLDGRFFEDRTQQYGLGVISRPFLGWGCGFFDFDHDGDEDLLIVNGHVYPQATRATMDSEYEQVPLLFERRGGRFERLKPETAGAWLGEAHRDRTLVFGDLDDDGDIDVIVAELNGPLRLLRNDLIGPDSDPKAAPWVIVELDDRRSPGNRRGLGAVVECRAGDLLQRRWIYGGGPFMSNAVAMAHFGVPGAAEAVEISVVWPDGERTGPTLVAPGRQRVVRE